MSWYVCSSLVFFLNDNEAILLLVKLQINTPVLFQNKTMLHAWVFVYKKFGEGVS